MEPFPENPFRPGAGRTPPVRAGHEKAAAYLATGLKRVGNRGDGDMVVVYGPRGNGKTALLGELHERAKDEGVPTITLNTSEMGGSVTLARLLAAETAGFWPKIREAGISLLDFGARVALGHPRELTAGNALRRHLRRPLLLMVDEAHAMPVGFGSILLKAAQDCIQKRFPLLLVLAGTPGLPIHLGKMDVSFVERCEKLRLGRLESPEAVREALAKPARDSGMPIDTDALEQLVEESQRYPFFVQRLGHESWNAARVRGARQITLDDAQNGIAHAREELQMFYRDRRHEAGEQNVLGEAEAVSKIVVAKGGDVPITTVELVDAVRGVAVPNGRSPDTAWRRLEHLGLVWEASKPDCWEPGIPSLCRYIADKAGVPASAESA